MDEYKNNSQPDGVTPNQNGENVSDTGYTVTPNGGFYSKRSEDIIQDDIQSDRSYSSYSTQTERSYENAPTYTSKPYDDFYVEPMKAKKPKNSHSTAVVIISAVLAAIIGAVSAVVFMGSAFKLETSTDSTVQNVTGTKNNVSINVDETATSIAEAVSKKCTDSVVGIRTTTSVASFFGQSQNQSGEGSGVIYSSDGYIITNYHVISEAVESSNSKIDVFIGDSKSEPYSASVVGYNISCDLAVIKIDANGLTAVEFGNSDELNVGQYVITIGAPGGLEFMGSVTYGIISGLERTVSTDSTLKLIQIDAAINPGNSGGALLDAEGKLIGINSSKIVSESYEGMGFAIPVNNVKEICDKIISRKNDGQPYLGVSISNTYTSEVLSYYGYPSGAVVSSVADGSPADKVGIERGDIITEFNGTAITEYTVLSDAMYECEPNDTVSIKIYRSGRYYTVNVKLTSDTSN